MDDNIRAFRLVYDKLGVRRYSLNSLREKIEDQFFSEYEGRDDLLAELDSYAKQFRALQACADYVLATEYVNLATEEKRRLIEEAVADIFYFGALDSYLRDPALSEVTIERVQEVGVRRGWGAVTRVESPFESLPHLERLLSALLAPTGASLRQDQPFLEVGTVLYERPTRFSLICPPVSPLYSVQIRLHPTQAPSLEQLIADGILDAPRAAQMVDVLAAGRGLIVTGEVGAGKSTLINALLNALPDAQHIALVERAREARPPAGVKRWPAPVLTPDAGDFSAWIQAALGGEPLRLLVLDEVRGDEALAFWQALNAPQVGGVVLAFRGSGNAARLHSALSMAIRKGQFALESEAINAALLEKTPYVAVLHHQVGDDRPRLHFWGRWQAEGEGLRLAPFTDD